MRNFWTVTVLFVACIVEGLGAQSRIVLAAEDDWYPYSAKVGSSVQGFAVDLITAAYKAAGATVTYEIVPFSRAMAGVKSGVYAGCFDAGESDELRVNYLLPKHQLAVSEQAVWGGNTASTVKSYADLEGSVVGITNGYTYSPLLTGNDKITKDVASIELASLKKVAMGRNDYTIVDWWVAQYLLSQNRTDLVGKVKQVGVLQSSRIVPVFSKTHPDGAKALELYEAGMVIIHSNGAFDTIMKGWADKFQD